MLLFRLWAEDLGSCLYNRGICFLFSIYLLIALSVDHLAKQISLLRFKDYYTVMSNNQIF
jgi:hypothetical protein